jgi:heptosyltransferase I
MDGLFGFAGYLGITTRTLRWDFAIAPADAALAAELAAGARPLCVISPCSSQRFRNYRNWSVANYVAVARHLQERHGARIVITGGPTDLEREYGAAITAGLGGHATNLVGQTSLKQLYAILAAADVLLCPDSGPAHMATAAGTPVVGLYATSNRLRTGPDFSQDLVVDAYPEAVQRELGKRPEDLRWGERVRNPAAMDLITVPAVIERLGQALARGRHVAGPAPTGGQ